MLDSILEQDLMQVFGGYSELENAPDEIVVKQALIWQARCEAEAEIRKQGEAK